MSTEEEENEEEEEESSVSTGNAGASEGGSVMPPIVPAQPVTGLTHIMRAQANLLCHHMDKAAATNMSIAPNRARTAETSVSLLSTVSLVPRDS